MGAASGSGAGADDLMSTTINKVFDDQTAELEHIYQTAPVGLCLLDRDLRYLRINKRLAEMHGKPRLEHIGCTIREVLPALAPTLCSVESSRPANRS